MNNSKWSKCNMFVVLWVLSFIIVGCSGKDNPESFFQTGVIVGIGERNGKDGSWPIQVKLLSGKVVGWNTYTPPIEKMILYKMCERRKPDNNDSFQGYNNLHTTVCNIYSSPSKKNGHTI